MSRALIVSDVHANAPALEAVLDAEPDHDTVVFLGDAVDCGPHPEAVCQRLLDCGLLVGVRGNHDQTVLDMADTTSPTEGVYAQWQAWTFDRLSAESRAFLDALDRKLSISAGGQLVRLHHGDFPRPSGHEGTWPTRATPDEDPALYETVAARYAEDVIVHGHSHFPFTATVAGTTFVNPGSVGLQRPGWPMDRAYYAVLEDGTFDLRSVEYDPSAVIADLQDLESPFSENWDRMDAPTSTP